MKSKYWVDLKPGRKKIKWDLEFIYAKGTQKEKKTTLWQQVVDATGFGCNLIQCEGLLGIHSTIIEREVMHRTGLSFAVFREQNKDKDIRHNLRMALMDEAIRNRNPACLIFAAKNELGMSDRIESKNENINHNIDENAVFNLRWADEETIQPAIEAPDPSTEENS